MSLSRGKQGIIIYFTHHFYTVDCPVEINLPFGLSPEFSKIRGSFGGLILDVIEAMRNNVDCEDLRLYIELCRNHLAPKLAVCQTTDEIVKEIACDCSLIDITLLENAVERFKVTQVKPAIEKYKREIEQFHQQGPLRLFLNQQFSLASPLQCEKVIITINREIGEYRLPDIKLLITVAFERLAPHIKVIFIEESNSFTITCSFPFILSETLIATALDNIESLIEKGLQKFIIGYCTIYDEKEVITNIIMYEYTATYR